MVSSVFLATLGVAVASHAQTRPTLSDVESRVGVLESEVSALETELGQAKNNTCISADVLGDTYRPAHCDARCDCLMSAPGEFSACTVETGGGGTTYSVDLDLEIQLCANGLCTDQTSCVSDADCAAPYEFCSLNFCFANIACTVSSDCPVVTDAVADYFTINQNGTLDSDVASCAVYQGSTTQINYKDSVECVAQVEAQLGEPCAPVP
jgi:hypothetical protein